MATKAVDTRPEIGEQYVWEIPKVNFGPVFMTVRRVIGGRSPRVIFDCIGPDGRPYSRPRPHPLPLPASVRRERWTDRDIRKAVATLHGRTP